MTIKHLLTCSAVLMVPLAGLHAAEPKPNILWLVAEDANVNWFGCYGSAQQPHRSGEKKPASAACWWPVLMTGTFGIGGPLATNFTDPSLITPNQQRFYRIVSP